MRMIFLGIRNLARSPKRTADVAILLALAFVALIFLTAMDNAGGAATEELLAKTHNVIEIRPRGQWGHVNMQGNSETLPESTPARASAVPGVTKTEKYLIAMYPTRTLFTSMVVGYEPGTEPRLESHGEVGAVQIVAGRDLTPDDAGKDVAIVGVMFAEEFGITRDNFRGRTITIDPEHSAGIVYASPGEPRALEVVGLFETGYVFGDNHLFTPMDTFKRIYTSAEGLTKVSVTVVGADNVAPVMDALKREFGATADVVAPRTSAEAQTEGMQRANLVSALLQALAFLVLVAIILFTMLTIVQQRATEIATLKAIGASTAAIARGLMTEAAAYTLTGAALAFVALAAAREKHGRLLFEKFFSFVYPSAAGVRLSDYFPMGDGQAAATAALLLVLAILIAILGSGLALWRIARLSPAEAMRRG